MKTIFITISRGSLFRNFFHSGVIDKLLKNNKVVILTSDISLFDDYKKDNLFIEPLIEPKKIKFNKIIKEFLKGAIFNKTIFYRCLYKFGGAKPMRILFLPRILFFAPTRYIPYFKNIIRFLDYIINPQKEHDYLFKKHKPDLVFSTTPHNPADVGVLKSAKRFKVQTVGMPKSWDNLSKILFNVKMDYMMVWGEFMKKQAIQYQGYKDKEIIIVGAPQFDIYANKKYLLDREEFCQKFNFDPKKKIILYGSSGTFIKNEADYLMLIKNYIDSGKLKDVQVLIRPHLGYLGDIDKYQEFDRYNNFEVDKTDKQNNKLKDHWDTSFNHLVHLFNSLYHADVCINIASTLTLDSAMCNTPVINIKFDIDNNIDFNESITRFYLTDYVKALSELGWSWVVQDEEEFLKILSDILKNNIKKDEDLRKEFIKYFMYKNDRRSAERISNYLIKIANNNYAPLG